MDLRVIKMLKLNLQQSCLLTDSNNGSGLIHFDSRLQLMNAVVMALSLNDCVKSLNAQTFKLRTQYG